jgi:hypothetical protein
MIACVGIHVHLAVIAERISQEVWQQIYDQARRVATQWTPRPLAFVWRHIGAVQGSFTGLVR